MRPASFPAATCFIARPGERQAFALVEVMLAIGLLAFVFASIYLVSGHSAKLVTRSELASEAQRNCLSRVDQLRALGWAKVSRPDEIAIILSQPSGSAIFEREIISVYALPVPQTSPQPTPAPAPQPAPGSAPLFTVSKGTSGAPVIVPAGFDPETTLAARQLNYRVLTEWRASGRLHQREISTVVSRSAAR